MSTNKTQLTTQQLDNAAERSNPISFLLHKLSSVFNLNGRTAVISIPYIWLVLFFLVPFVFVLKISLAETLLARPPYSSLFEFGEGALLSIKLNFENYLFLLEDKLYIAAYMNSIKVAFISTLICLIIGYPMAYAIKKAPASYRNILLMMVILPFWTSFLLRVYAWMGILKNNGLINNMLMGLGIIDDPIVMLRTDLALYLGIVYSYLPFMILPLYTTIEKLDDTLLEAASDLGSKPWAAFINITLPLSMPGIIAGSLLVFIPAVGEFVIPALLGGPDSLMIGSVLWNEFFNNRDWPVASAVAIVMLLILVIPIMLLRYYQAKDMGE